MASLTLQETVCSGLVLLSKVPPKPVIFAVRRKYFAFGLYRSKLLIISLVMMRWVMSQYILQCISSCPLTQREQLNSRGMCAWVQCRKHFTLTKFDHVKGDILTWPELASVREGQDEDEAVRDLWGKLAIVLQRGNAAILANRVPEFPAPAIDGSHWDHWRVLRALAL